MPKAQYEGRSIVQASLIVPLKASSPKTSSLPVFLMSGGPRWQIPRAKKRSTGWRPGILDRNRRQQAEPCANRLARARDIGDVTCVNLGLGFPATSAQVRPERRHACGRATRDQVREVRRAAVLTDHLTRKGATFVLRSKDTTMTARRNFTDQSEAKAALEALRCDKSEQETATRHLLNPIQSSTGTPQAIDRIAAYLHREDSVFGPDRIGRVMARKGHEAICRRPGTSPPHPQHPGRPCLLRKLLIDRQNQVLYSSSQAATAGRWMCRHPFNAGQNGSLHSVPIMG